MEIVVGLLAGAGVAIIMIVCSILFIHLPDAEGDFKVQMTLSILFVILCMLAGATFGTAHYISREYLHQKEACCSEL